MSTNDTAKAKNTTTEEIKRMTRNGLDTDLKHTTLCAGFLLAIGGCGLWDSSADTGGSTHEGFEWVDANDSDNSVLSFLRRDRDGNAVACVFNFTPVPRHNHRIGVPGEGWWAELVNTDASEYGGSGHGNMGGVEATPVPAHGRPWSLSVTLPPLGALFFQRQ